VISRREIIKIVLVGVLVLGCSTIGINAFGQAPKSPTCRAFFCNELPMPRFAQKVTDAGEIKSILDQATTEASGSHRITPQLRTFLEQHADFYEITMERALQQILPGEKTEIWGYNDRPGVPGFTAITPGPTIATTRMHPVVIRFTNNLSTPTEPVETIVHYHGGHTPPSSDGIRAISSLPLTFLLIPEFFSTR